MEPEAAARRLEATAKAIEALARGVDGEQARWKPAPEKWSILEVVNHLHDEEREDFRQRLDYTLHRPGERWPKIDPEGWVAARGYAERDLDESLDRFLAERRQSVEWLRGLESPDLDAVYEHPRGRVSAGDLLAAWLAHDLLHVRQLARLRYQHLAAAAHPYRLEYAGEW